jgi:50S ribosome-binding GTPase
MSRSWWRENEHYVVLIGKLGHGKTMLLNKLCGTRFTSVMCAESCTRQNQFGQTLRHGITVIDTPGFGSSDDTGSHIQAQRSAIEGIRNSGIYLVVKYSASSDMAECLNHLMDFVGVDDVRIIVTHADCADRSQGFDEQEIVSDLSKRLDVDGKHICLVGKDTDASTIEEFVYQTLHTPRQFKMDSEQLAYASSLTVGARQFNSDIERAGIKLDVVETVLKHLFAAARETRSRRANVQLALEATLVASANVVGATRDQIAKQSNDLTPEQRRIVEDKIGKDLILRWQRLRESVVRLNLHSWDPATKKRKQASFQNGNQKAMLTCTIVPGVSNSAWIVQFRWKGSIVALGDFLALDIAPEWASGGSAKPKSQRVGPVNDQGNKSRKEKHGGGSGSPSTARAQPSPKKEQHGARAHRLSYSRSRPYNSLGAGGPTQTAVSVFDRSSREGDFEVLSELEDVDLEAQHGRSHPKASREIAGTEPSARQLEIETVTPRRTVCGPGNSLRATSRQPTPPSPEARRDKNRKWFRWCCTLSLCLMAAVGIVGRLRSSEGR